jgi:hypothetical protein
MRARPSSLALTVACHASLQLQESVPPLPDTDEEAEGTAAHWVARRRIAGFGHELPVGAKFFSDGREWAVTLDMHAGAVLYERALGGVHPDLRIEEFIASPRVHPTECGGTPDASRFFLDARAAYETCPEDLPLIPFLAGQLRLLRVGDYKFGHRYVEVFENMQLGAGYLSGLLARYNLDDNDPFLYVEMILVQPRSYHRDGMVRVWRGPAHMIRGIVNVANYAVEMALGPNPHMQTGKHCLDCRARHVCRALQVNTMHLADFSQSYERSDLPSWAVGQELMIVQDAIKRLEARETGLAAQGEALLRAGQPIPFYHMEPGRSNLSYKEDVKLDELVGLSELVNVDITRPVTIKDRIVTPTQAIQLGISPEVMKHYADRPPGKMRFVRDNSITARKVFAK